MNSVADLSEKYSFNEIRVTHEQNLVLPHVRNNDLLKVWNFLKLYDLATPNIGLITDTICCPGMDYCALATARSIPISQRITEFFKDQKIQKKAHSGILVYARQIETAFTCFIVLAFFTSLSFESMVLCVLRCFMGNVCYTVQQNCWPICEPRKTKTGIFFTSKSLNLTDIMSI